MNYPKMLYKGNTEKYQHIIAQDADHEAELVESGYVNFDQLEYPKTIDSGSVGESTQNAVIAVEQFDAVAEKLVGVEQERDQLKTEVERLNSVIKRGSAENIALHKRIEELTAPEEPTEPVKPKTTRTKAE